MKHKQSSPKHTDRACDRRQGGTWLTEGIEIEPKVGNISLLYRYIQTRFSGITSALFGMAKIRQTAVEL